MSSFIKQFYGSASYIPPLLVLQHPLEDKSLIEAWLQSRRGAKVRLLVPSRGHKKQLVKIVAENAEQSLQHLEIKQQASPSNLNKALDEIARELHLPHPPLRIECYDISDIQGTAAVGSMVVFEKGKPKPSYYRRFRIKTVSGADDYAMLREVISRRFKRVNLRDDNTSTANTWAVIPDLILIDGGKGQLGAVLSEMQEAGAASIPAAGLAKENEEIFLPQQTEAIVLPHSSPGLQLLQRIRDEAHRFALSYHQRVRTRETFTSSLDIIPGIGPKRKRALLKQFGSIRAIREASFEELASVKSMTRKQAEKIKEYL